MTDYLKEASKIIEANNDDSDIKWAGQVMTKAKQLKHADLKVLNTQVLDASGIKYKKASEEAYLFREENKPKVDFYPSTGRWRVAGYKKTFRGGAKSFISWYKRN